MLTDIEKAGMEDTLKRIKELQESNRLLRTGYETMIQAYHDVAGTYRDVVSDKKSYHDPGSFKVCTNVVCKNALRLLGE